MATHRLTQDQFKALEAMERDELLTFIANRFVARKPGPKAKGNAMPVRERVKRWRDRRKANPVAADQAN